LARQIDELPMANDVLRGVSQATAGLAASAVEPLPSSAPAASAWLKSKAAKATRLPAPRLLKTA